MVKKIPHTIEIMSYPIFKLDIDQLEMTDWQSAIYRHSSRIYPSLPFVDYCLKLSTTVINRKHFHLCSPCPWPRYLACWSYVCTFYSLPDTCVDVHGSQHDPLHLCHREQQIPREPLLPPGLVLLSILSSNHPLIVQLVKMHHPPWRDKQGKRLEQDGDKSFLNGCSRLPEYIWYFHTGIWNKNFIP